MKQAGKIDIILDASGPLAKEYGNGNLALDLPIDQFMVPLETMVKSRFITARAAARHMFKQHSGVIILVMGSPARPHAPGIIAIGAAFGAIENLTANLAFEVSPFAVRVVCVRTLANVDSRSIQDTMGFITDQLKITRDQALAQIAQSNFLKVAATVQTPRTQPCGNSPDAERYVEGRSANRAFG